MIGTIEATALMAEPDPAQHLRPRFDAAARTRHSKSARRALAFSSSTPATAAKSAATAWRAASRSAQRWRSRSFGEHACASQTGGATNLRGCCLLQKQMPPLGARDSRDLAGSGIKALATLGAGSPGTVTTRYPQNLLVERLGEPAAVAAKLPRNAANTVPPSQPAVDRCSVSNYFRDLRGVPLSPLAIAQLVQQITSSDFFESRSAEKPTAAVNTKFTRRTRSAARQGLGRSQRDRNRTGSATK